MYFDNNRNAYIDRDTGEVVFQEADNLDVHIPSSDFVDYDIERPPTSNSSTSPRSAGVVTPTKSTFRNLIGSLSLSGSRDSRRISTNSRPVSNNTTGSHQLIRYISNGHIEMGTVGAAVGSGEDQKTQLEEDLYNVHGGNNYDAVGPSEQEKSADPSRWDDWSLARALQALEFEIPQETDPYEDFNNKEYRASQSCFRQFATLSFFICIVQIALLITMVQWDGWAPTSQNEAIGPPVYSMVRFGAKEAALIVYRGEYWRLLSAIMLHAGIIHIIPNVAIQLRVGGYLNLIYGTPKFFFIYFVTGFFGSIMSCLIFPNDVGVGSSGALMGILASWVVWIVFRWDKIPPECRSQRNCQLFTVIAAIVVTLATSFLPAVDYAAHVGGAFQGLLWGIVLLGSESEEPNKQMAIRFIAAVIAIVTYAMALWYLIVDLKPSQASLPYWAENDDWHHPR